MILAYKSFSHVTSTPFHQPQIISTLKGKYFRTKLSTFFGAY